MESEEKEKSHLLFQNQNSSKRKGYTIQQLTKALKSVEEKKCSLSEAARIYKIPRQTLSNKFFGKSPVLCTKPGPEAVLGKDVEKEIENWILDAFSRGFSLPKEAIIHSVKKVIDEIPEEIKQKLPFKNNTPGKGWYSSFRKRHPKVMEKYNESKLNIQCTDDDLSSWFFNAEAIIDADDAEDAIHDPSRVFIMHEIAMKITSKNELILSDRKKSFGRPTKNDELNFSFLLTADANGKVTIPCTPWKSDSSETVIDPLVSEVSLMCEIFYDSVVNTFYPYLVEKQCSFPIVMFLGCEFPYLSLPLSNFCKEKGLSLICLPRNCKEMQSLDLFIHQVLNEEWKRYNLQSNQIGLSLQHLIDILHELIREDAFESYIVHQFQSSKLYPFNAEERSKKPTQYNKILKNYPRNEAVDYMEREIPHGILMQFRKCRTEKIPWNGAVDYTAFYHFWSTIVDDVKTELHFTEENFTDSVSCDDIEVEWMDVGEADM